MGLNPRAALAIGLLAAAHPAMAANGVATNNITFLDASSSSNVTITYFNGSRYVSEATAAGFYRIADSKGAQFNAFCTDPFDSIYNGESWKVTSALTSSTLGLSSATYPYGPYNVRAIDYIGQNFTNKGSQPAAQVAVWDLVLGGHVSYNAAQDLYYYDSGVFTATGVSAKDVYNVEQKALKSKGSSGSLFLRQVNGSQPSQYGRPQDLVTHNPSIAAVPEPSAPQMAICMMIGLAAVWGFGRKKNSSPGR
ncbi:hypothetical protein CCAX7_005070 [Capsulimonas corticalis]|uniref:Uncharacterized protein n=1 Tax=Capsulimonas corticalis TaxID=2219043 RepID=A0A402D2T5_9BACT|nr:hypothetical protein [Capsulimonas corticalis]BDI28456.1 hypothetical protein CCAX7_005070 [Capsulimonas corticalis]